MIPSSSSRPYAPWGPILKWVFVYLIVLSSAISVGLDDDEPRRVRRDHTIIRENSSAGKLEQNTRLLAHLNAWPFEEAGFRLEESDDLSTGVLEARGHEFRVTFDGGAGVQGFEFAGKQSTTEPGDGSIIATPAIMDSIAWRGLADRTEPGSSWHLQRIEREPGPAGTRHRYLWWQNVDSTAESVDRCHAVYERTRIISYGRETVSTTAGTEERSAWIHIIEIGAALVFLLSAGAVIRTLFHRVPDRAFVVQSSSFVAVTCIALRVPPRLPIVDVPEFLFEVFLCTALAFMTAALLAWYAETMPMEWRLSRLFSGRLLASLSCRRLLAASFLGILPWIVIQYFVLDSFTSPIMPQHLLVAYSTRFGYLIPGLMAVLVVGLGLSQRLSVFHPILRRWTLGILEACTVLFFFARFLRYGDNDHPLLPEFAFLFYGALFLLFLLRGLRTGGIPAVLLMAWWLSISEQVIALFLMRDPRPMTMVWLSALALTPLMVHVVSRWFHGPVEELPERYHNSTIVGSREPQVPHSVSESPAEPIVETAVGRVQSRNRGWHWTLVPALGSGIALLLCLLRYGARPPLLDPDPARISTASRTFLATVGCPVTDPGAVDLSLTAVGLWNQTLPDGSRELPPGLDSLRRKGPLWIASVPAGPDSTRIVLDGSGRVLSFEPSRSCISDRPMGKDSRLWNARQHLPAATVEGDSENWVLERATSMPGVSQFRFVHCDSTLADPRSGSPIRIVSVIQYLGDSLLSRDAFITNESRSMSPELLESVFEYCMAVVVLHLLFLFAVRSKVRISKGLLFRILILGCLFYLESALTEVRGFVFFGSALWLQSRIPGNTERGLHLPFSVLVWWPTIVLLILVLQGILIPEFGIEKAYSVFQSYSESSSRLAVVMDETGLFIYQLLFNREACRFAALRHGGGFAWRSVWLLILLPATGFMTIATTTIYRGIDSALESWMIPVGIGLACVYWWFARKPRDTRWITMCVTALQVSFLINGRHGAEVLTAGCVLTIVALAVCLHLPLPGKVSELFRNRGTHSAV